MLVGFVIISILGPLLFLIYVNDLPNVSKILNLILFADDTNIFHSHKNIHTLYSTVNQELKKIEEWFKCNKLSLNTKKTKYTLFHKTSRRDNLPLKLPKVILNDSEIKKEDSIKFLGVILDEHLNWNKYISTVVNKISKNIGIIRRAKPFLDFSSLKKLYYSFIHSYLNYCNLAWASTHKTKLKKVFSKQKQACRIIFNMDKNAPTYPQFLELKALNIFKLNVFQVLLFMFKCKNHLNPKIFDDQISKINHKYQTRHSLINLSKPKVILKHTSFSINYRGPHLWNSYLQPETKSLTNFSRFKAIIKEKLLLEEPDRILSMCF